MIQSQVRPWTNCYSESTLTIGSTLRPETITCWHWRESQAVSTIDSRHLLREKRCIDMGVSRPAYNQHGAHSGCLRSEERALRRHLYWETSKPQKHNTPPPTISVYHVYLHTFYFLLKCLHIVPISTSVILIFNFYYMNVMF